MATKTPRNRAARRAILAVILVGATIVLSTGATPVLSPSKVAAASPAPAKMMAYLSYTAATQGKASFRKNADYIDEISPSWWRPADAADGSLSLQQEGVTVEDTAFVAEAKNAGSDV